LTRLGK